MSEIQHVRIKDISGEHAGQVVCIKGWLRNKPGGKGRYFLWLRDGSGEIQAVAEEANLPAEVWAEVERIGIESSIIVAGLVRAHPKNEGEFELELQGITVVQAVAGDAYPIGKKEHGVEFLMKHRHLWLRGKRQSAILRIRSEVHKAFADFFYERGFYRVDTPIFTPAACEGTTNLFEVDYHGDTVYLAQSGQLYNEADIGALGQVYCFGPTFRAEKSKTRRHLLEFWMLEMEAAYSDHFANMKFQEEMMAYTTRRVLDRCEDELKHIWASVRDKQKRSWEEWIARLEPATQTPYPKIRYGDTIEIVNEARIELLKKLGRKKWWKEKYGSFENGIEVWLKGELDTGHLFSRKDAEKLGFEDEPEEGKELANVDIKPFRWGDDYGAPDEAAIGAKFDRPVFVTNFPVEIKGFYFKDEASEDGTLAVDPVFAKLQAEHPNLIAQGSTGHTVLGSDLIGNEGAGELIGGSQREDDLARLEEKIAHHKLPREAFEWYVDLRRYGSVPHAGFGLGLERTIAWLCGGLDNPVHIRETITFPRMLHQYEP